MPYSRVVTWVLIAWGVILVLAILASVWVATAFPWPVPFYGMHQFGGGLAFFMVIWMLFFLAVVVGLVVLLISWSSRRPRGAISMEDPREIAKRRYARGEITKEQFDQIMKDLGQ